MAIGENSTQSSETALAVLMFTSVATTEADPAVRVDDPIGPRLMRWSDGQYAVGKLPMLHRMFRRRAEKSDPGAYGYMAARLRWMDDIVRREVADGVDQLVILGAGYDTRAYRMRDELDGVQVFEVDVPATSRDKRARLKKVFGSVPADVTYVEVDFNRQRFIDRLSEHGHDGSARTLFVLSGVSMYLPEEAVLDLLSQVAAHSPAGSSIVFDHFFDDVVSHPERYRGAREWIGRANSAGEEPQYGVAMAEVGSVVANCGLRLDSQCDMTELEERYLRRADGTSVEKPYDFGAVAHAIVTG